MNITVYCQRCAGQGVIPQGQPGAGQDCRLCQQGVIGFITLTDLQAVIQDMLTNLGVQAQGSRFTGF